MLATGSFGSETKCVNRQSSKEKVQRKSRAWKRTVIVCRLSTSWGTETENTLLTFSNTKYPNFSTWCTRKIEAKVNLQWWCKFLEASKVSHFCLWINSCLHVEVCRFLLLSVIFNRTAIVLTTLCKWRWSNGNVCYKCYF